MERTRTILVVDDEATVRTLLTQSLQRFGFRLLEAGAGTEALAVARDYREDIDALVCDVVMPGMDGPALARKLCAARPGLKVILISGYCEEPPSMEPNWEFLSKPFSPFVLCHKIEKLCATES
jgi:CheY-like chemotaxis protein